MHDGGFYDWKPLLGDDEQDGRSYGNVSKTLHPEARITMEDDELEIVSVVDGTVYLLASSFIL